MLNTFPGVVSLEPTDPELLSTYHKIVTGRKPHQAHLCNQLGLSDQTYVSWLRLLFILLMDVGARNPAGWSNLFEGVIKRLFENPDTQAAAFVWMYDQDRCLLSDRGFCQPIPDGVHMAMSFNLCSTAFVDYVFADAATLVQGHASPEFVAKALADWKRIYQPSINVTVMRNDRDALARFNRRIIEQCYERVYCSAKSGLILS